MMKKMEDIIVWDEVDASHITPEETEKAYREVLRRSRVAEGLVREQQRLDRCRYLRVSLSVAACLVALFVFLFYRVGKETSSSLCQYAAVAGETKEVTLPDQSRVKLNGGSLLIFADSFKDTREVFLSGEAVFDVTADEEHPFFVRTADVTIRVVGTRFDVKAYPDDAISQTTLERGKVQVWPNRDQDRVVTLNPSEQFLFERQSGAVTTQSIRLNEAFAWEHGEMCFRSASIFDIIKVLERQSGCKVHLTTQRYNSSVITARFVHGETPDEVMEALCAVIPGMRYQREGNYIYIQ